MSEPLPLPQEPGIDCKSFQLNTAEAATGKVLTCLDSAGNANWGAGGAGGISTLVITGNATLPNSSNNIIINVASGSVITLTLPTNPTSGIFYNFIQPNNVKVVLESAGKSFNLSYINMNTSTFSFVRTNNYIYIANLNLFASGPTINYGIIYNSTNTLWRTLKLGNASSISALSNASTIVANRYYGMYQERNTNPSPIVITFTNQNNAGQTYPNETIGLSSDTANALLKINGSVVSSGITNSSGVLQFNTVSNSASTFNAEISCNYNKPFSASSSLTIQFSVDDSTFVTDKSNISANGIDYAILTTTIKDANNYKYSGKIIADSNLNGTDIIFNPTSTTTNVLGVAQSQVSSNVLQSNITIISTNTTDNYILTPTVLLNFVTPDPFPSYGTIYGWYRWDTFNISARQWNDAYRQHNGPVYSQAPTLDAPNKLLNFGPNVYYFFNSGFINFVGCYFIRVRYPAYTDPIGYITDNNSLSYATITNQYPNWLINSISDSSAMEYVEYGISPFVETVQLNKWYIFCLNMTSTGVVFAFKRDNVYRSFSTPYSGSPISNWNSFIHPTSYLRFGTGAGFEISDVLIYQNSSQISNQDIEDIINNLDILYA